MKMPQQLRESISRLQFTGHIMQNSLQMFPHNNLCLQSVRKKKSIFELFCWLHFLESVCAKHKFLKIRPL